MHFKTLLNRPVLTSFLAFAVAGSAYSASMYLGDAAAQGLAVTDQADPDGANGGNVSYALHTSPYTNTSGAAELVTLTEVNFWADNLAGGTTLTPFVALYNGGGVAPAASYSFLSIGDPITGATGLNNASFDVGGSNPTVTLNNGESIVAGFHQDGRMVPFGAGTPDYLDEGNELAAGVGGTFGEDAQWSTLGRSYALNIGFEVSPVPEPSLPALLALPVVLLGLLSRRRRAS